MGEKSNYSVKAALACLALGVLLLSAGCVDSITTDSDDTVSEAYVTVETVGTVPENATVVESTNDSVQETGPIRDALREAANESTLHESTPGSLQLRAVTINDSEEEQVTEAIRSLVTDDQYGLYVRHDGRIYYVSVTRYL